MTTPLNEAIYDREVYSIAVDATGVAAGTYDIKVSQSSFNILKGFSIIASTLDNATLTLLVENKSGNEMDITNCLFGVTELDTSEPWITDIGLPVKNLILRVDCTGGSSNVTIDFFSPRS